MNSKTDLSKYIELLREKGLSDKEIQEIVNTIRKIIEDAISFKLSRLSKEKISELKKEQGKGYEAGQKKLRQIFKDEFNTSLDSFLYKISSLLFEEVIKVFDDFSLFLKKVESLDKKDQISFMNLIASEKLKEAMQILK